MQNNHVAYKGHADDVVKLGYQLSKQGYEQVGQSQNEGETVEEVAACMDIVFAAVVDSSGAMLWSFGRPAIIGRWRGCPGQIVVY